MPQKKLQRARGKAPGGREKRISWDQLPVVIPCGSGAESFHLTGSNLGHTWSKRSPHR